MKLSKTSAAIIMIAIVFASCNKDNNPVNPITGNNDNSIAEQYIVVLESGSGAYSEFGGGATNIAEVSKSLLESNNISNSNVVALYDKVLNGFCAKLTYAQVNQLRKDKRIIQIEKDQPVYTCGFLESYSPKQNSIQAQTTPWGIAAVGGSVDATDATGVAWIVDSGVDLDHPDLNVNTTLAKTIFTSGADALSADDGYGHGTHVAGIIAARNNDQGVVGVCAGAMVIPVKVFSSTGAGSMAGILAGLNYISDNLIPDKMNIVNMSLTGSAYTLLDNAVVALAAKGAYIVIASGNNYYNANYYSPARANGNHIYTISAYDVNGKWASFSDYGTSVDYSAPGKSILSLYKNGGTATMSGTSMACPHVVGILLANNGLINSNGTVTSDPDGSPDLKAVR